MQDMQEKNVDIVVKELVNLSSKINKINDLEELKRIQRHVRGLLASVDYRIITCNMAKHKHCC